MLFVIALLFGSLSRSSHRTSSEKRLLDLINENRGLEITPEYISEYFSKENRDELVLATIDAVNLQVPWKQNEEQYGALKIMPQTFFAFLKRLDYYLELYFKKEIDQSVGQYLIALISLQLAVKYHENQADQPEESFWINIAKQVPGYQGKTMFVQFGLLLWFKQLEFSDPHPTQVIYQFVNHFETIVEGRKTRIAIGATRLFEKYFVDILLYYSDKASVLAMSLLIAFREIGKRSNPKWETLAKTLEFSEMEKGIVNVVANSIIMMRLGKTREEYNKRNFFPFDKYKGLQYALREHQKAEADLRLAAKGSQVDGLYAPVTVMTTDDEEVVEADDVAKEVPTKLNRVRRPRISGPLAGTVFGGTPSKSRESPPKSGG
eukprot:NODE_87_length_21893_cov_0.496559.p4 type:complete len:377 gc:universal NODE_87_length_21893_cov_0.496559:10754-9624(-)